MSDFNPGQGSYEIDGVPVESYANSTGQVVSVTTPDGYTQTATWQGSPLVIYFDPPVEGLNAAGVPQLLKALAMLGVNTPFS